MGFWLVVGQAALRVGLPALAKYALDRLTRKEATTRVQTYRLEDAQYHAKVRQAERRQRKLDAQAKR